MPWFKLLKIKNVLQLRVLSRHYNHFYINTAFEVLQLTAQPIAPPPPPLATPLRIHKREGQREKLMETGWQMILYKLLDETNTKSQNNYVRLAGRMRPNPRFYGAQLRLSLWYKLPILHTDHVSTFSYLEFDIQGVNKVLHTLKIFISQKPHKVETLHFRQ